LHMGQELGGVRECRDLIPFSDQFIPKDFQQDNVVVNDGQANVFNCLHVSCPFPYDSTCTTGPIC